MSLDLTQFHDAFFEEAFEHLDAFEQLLLTTDLAEPDADALNAIFRAAHSIKGGSATFGFDEIRDVTHVMESKLDELRQGRARLTQAALDALLALGDGLRQLLQSRREQGAGDDMLAAVLLDQVAELALDPVHGAEAVAKLTQQTYRVQAKVSDDLHDELLGVCQALGTASGVERAEGWTRLTLVSPESEDAIRTMIDFAAAVAELNIERVPASAETPNLVVAAPTPTSSAAPEDLPTIAAPSSSSGAPTLAPKPPSARATPAAGAGDGSIRMSVEKIDLLVNLVGELVITQAMLHEAITGVPMAEESDAIASSVAQLQRNSRDLQEAVMSIRMLPVSHVFSRFPRMVRDLAQQLGKQVNLRFEGEGTELDKGIIEKIADPLTHLIRNSMDHGIENVAARRAAGKPDAGSIVLSASQQAGHIVIEVRDDGGGLHRERILAKAKQNRLPVRDDMADHEVWNLIFEPGFSTAQAVTDVSGRGVGMDVVRRNVDALGGRIDLFSVEGEGSRFTIRLPLTLAIIDGMVISVAEHRYLLPLAAMTESLKPTAGDLRVLGDGGLVLQIRGQFIPIIALAEVLAVAGWSERPEDGLVVVLDHDGDRVGLWVDDVIGQQQAVVKSLESNYRRVPGVSGATIMGDGSVGLILDVPGLVRLARTLPSKAAALCP